MHVLVTADTVGGVWTYTRELVTGLAGRGIRVTLVSFGGIPSAAQRAWLEPLSGVAYFPTRFRLEWMQDAEQDLDESTRYLHNLIRQSKPNLLHLSQFCYGALGVTHGLTDNVTLPKLVVAHSDVLSWSQAVQGAPPAGRWAEWYRAVVAAGLAGASLLVAPSRWMLGAIEGSYGAQPNARVIYNGRTPELFRPLADKQGYAASAGRLWDEGKQSRLLMEMDRPPLPILVAGAAALAGETAEVGGPHAPAGGPHLPVVGKCGGGWPTSARRWQMWGSADASGPAVQCTGELSEDAMRTLLSGAAIYLATSKYEPFGLAPLEAALSRCAIVANDIPSLREVWEDAALYFRKDDARSLGQALALLHGDRELCRDYADRAYARALRHYTAERMVDEYVQAYSALLERQVRAA